MQPEKIDLSTATISEEKLAQLRDLLPEVFHEGKINFDELKNALGEYVEDDPANERFGLRWPGKSKLQQVINTPSVGTLVPQPEESVDWDTTGNIIIEGDNLEVLKLLQKSYAGKVKMIYIDPPYNTGNDFVYPDKYASGLDTYLEFTGQKDENGQNLASNSDTSGRYHANWLNMMYPRLYLARNLLRQEGVIFVSIDDTEFAHLKAAMDGIFGDENFVGTLVHQRAKGGGQAKLIVKGHDNILIYSRNIHLLAGLGRRKENIGKTEIIDGVEYIVNDDVVRKVFGKYDTSLNDRRCFYEELEEYKGLSFKADIDRKVASGELHLRPWPNGMQVIVKLTPVDEARSKLYSIVRALSEKGREDLEALGLDAFAYPKPLELVNHLVASLQRGNNDLILDFFAGSGTTGHAVMQQNAEDGGNRKYILVQLPEPMEPKTLDDGTQLNTIADICRERVRRAGKKIADENPDKDLDIGFRAYKLAPSNFQPWDGANTDSGMMSSARQASFMPQTQQLSLEQRILQAADHLNPAADDIAILTELLLKLGEELTVPVEQLTLAGKTVYDINGNARLICLEREVTLDVIREMAAREPLEIICLDAGFPDDQTKVNAGQIIATQAQHIEGAIAFKVV